MTDYYTLRVSDPETGDAIPLAHDTLDGANHAYDQIVAGPLLELIHVQHSDYDPSDYYGQQFGTPTMAPNIGDEVVLTGGWAAELTDRTGTQTISLTTPNHDHVDLDMRVARAFAHWLLAATTPTKS